MCVQSEAALENELIDQLVSQGYRRVTIKDEADLKANFKRELKRR